MALLSVILNGWLFGFVMNKSVLHFLVVPHFVFTTMIPSSQYRFGIKILKTTTINWLLPLIKNKRLLVRQSFINFLLLSFSSKGFVFAVCFVGFYVDSGC